MHGHNLPRGRQYTFHSWLYLVDGHILFPHVNVHEHLPYLIVVIQQKQFKSVKVQLSPVVHSNFLYGLESVELSHAWITKLETYQRAT